MPLRNSTDGPRPAQDSGMNMDGISKGSGSSKTTDGSSSATSSTARKTSLINKITTSIQSYKGYMAARAEKKATKGSNTSAAAKTNTIAHGKGNADEDFTKEALNIFGESHRTDQPLSKGNLLGSAASTKNDVSYETLERMNFQTSINLNGAAMVKGVDAIRMRKDADALPTITTATQEFTALGDTLGYGNNIVEQNAANPDKNRRNLDEVVTRSFDAAGRFQMKDFRAVLEEKFGLRKETALKISDDTVETLQTNAALVQAASKEPGAINLNQFADRVVARQYALLLRTDISGDPISSDRGNGNTKNAAVDKLNAQIKTLVSSDLPKSELSQFPVNTRKAIDILKKEMKSHDGQLTANQISTALKKGKVDHSDFVENLVLLGKVDVRGTFNPADKLSGGGCGAVMRSAPVGEFFARMVNNGDLSPQEGLQATLDVGMRTGASTHASPLAFVPAAYHAGLVFLAATDATANMTPRQMHDIVVKQLGQEGVSTYMASQIPGAAGSEAFQAVWDESLAQLNDGIKLHDAMKGAEAGSPLANLGLNTPKAIYDTGLQFSHLKKETGRIDVANFEQRTAMAGSDNNSAVGYWPGRSGDDATIMSYEVVWRAMDNSADLGLPREAMDCTKSEIKNAFSKMDISQKERFISDVWKMGGFHDGDSDSTNAVACSFLIPLLGADNMRGVFADMRGMLHDNTIQ